MKELKLIFPSSIRAWLPISGLIYEAADGLPRLVRADYTVNMQGCMLVSPCISGLVVAEVALMTFINLLPERASIVSIASLYVYE
jgi:hypothetical protein